MFLAKRNNQSSVNLDNEKDIAIIKQLVKALIKSDMFLPETIYAKCAGFEGMMALYSLSDASSKATHELDMGDIKSGKEWFFLKFRDSISQPDWQNIFFGNSCKSIDASQLAVIEQTRARFLRTTSNFRDIIETTAFDFSIGLKRSNLEIVYYELEKKKNVLKPMFMKSILKGKNKYGDQEYSEYLKEIANFLQYLRSSNGFSFFVSTLPIIQTMRYLTHWYFDNEIQENIPSEGVDFEYWCSRKISAQGWLTRVTKSSGDQGVDIEASRENFVVAIQCKRYSNPVGNKAVQEIFAGQKNINANAAAVIGTGGFTNSANELATSTEVKLIDAENISSFSSCFGFINKESPSNNSKSITLNFSTNPEKKLAMVFRSVLGAFDDVGLLQNISIISRDEFLAKISSSGEGSVTLKSYELLMLLLMADNIFFSNVTLNKNNLLFLKANIFPNLDNLILENISSCELHELYGKNLTQQIQTTIRHFFDMLPAKPSLENYKFLAL